MQWQDALNAARPAVIAALRALALVLLRGGSLVAAAFAVGLALLQFAPQDVRKQSVSFCSSLLRQEIPAVSSCLTQVD